MWAFLVAAHPEKAAEEKRDDKAEDNMFVSPDHALLQYSGRIDFEEKEMESNKAYRILSLLCVSLLDLGLLEIEEET